ncbi:MAG TPA: PIG-L family deacetylase, partial [Chthoniobacterales bacterium]
ERGSDVTLCICSRGEAGTNGTPDEREAEARRAADLLSAEIVFLECGGDSHIAQTNENAFLLAREIRRCTPDIVLSSVTTEDQHPDHAAVGKLARDAVRYARYGGIAELRDVEPHMVAHHLQYAVTPGAEPDGATKLRVDISAQHENWIRLMECHATQLRTRRYIELQTARARLLGVEAGVEYAQALFASDDLLVASLAELPRSVRLF